MGIEESNIAQIVGAHFDLDPIQTYKWVNDAQKHHQSRVRSIGIVGTILLWTGFVVSIVGGLAFLGILTSAPAGAVTPLSILFVPGVLTLFIGILLCLSVSRVVRSAP